MKTITSIWLTVLGSLLMSAGFNLFLVPSQLLAGGVSGLSMIIGYMTGWKISLLYFGMNLPLLIWGWFAIGRRFIGYSVLSVILTTIFMSLIPEVKVTHDIILGAVFGGVTSGVGMSLCLRAGGSTGGFDIIGAIITRNRDFPIGSTLSVLNGVVVLSLGIWSSWDYALYSVVSRYISGRIIDMIHIGHVKVTAFIITDHSEMLMEKIMKLPHGVTMIKTQGGYSHTEKDMLMTVTTRYELAELNKIIRENDPNAFVNIVETVGIMGRFVRNKSQI